MVLRAVLVGALLLVATVFVHAQAVRDTIGPLEKAARPSSPENPVPKRIAFASPAQPAELTRINGGGGLRLWVTLDDAGRVAEIRKFGEPVVISRPDAPLDESSRRAIANQMLAEAVAAVRQWKYEAPGAPIVFVVLVNFAPGRPPTAAQQDVAAAQAAGGAAPVSTGRGVPVMPASAPWPAAEAVGAVRAGNGISPPRQTKSANPSYSLEAKEAKVQGTVRLEILVGTDGKVKDARVLQSASPLLNEPAIAAARRWEFTPTTVNGEPRPIILMLEFDFNLR